MASVKNLVFRFRNARNKPKALVKVVQILLTEVWARAAEEKAHEDTDKLFSIIEDGDRKWREFAGEVNRGGRDNAKVEAFSDYFRDEVPETWDAWQAWRTVSVD